MTSNITHSVRDVMFHTIFALVLVISSSSGASSGGATVHSNIGRRGAEEFHVDTTTGRIVDSHGRERLFHGLNVVVKGPPWHPSLELFDPLLSLCDADVEVLKSLGMNVVRLAVMWPGVEPKDGWINATYLQVMRSIVGKLNSAGIYSLIEFHQDLFSSQFCGEGLPSWILSSYSHSNSQSTFTGQTANRLIDGHQILKTMVVDDDRQTVEGKNGLKVAGTSEEFVRRRRHDQSGWVGYAASFPEPLNRRWFTDENDATDSKLEEKCKSFDWYWYYVSYAVSKSFQDLYENTLGWADRMANFWKVVANAFREDAGVLGYELFNEPWAGDFYHNPLLLMPGVADKINLVPFYDKLQAAVRSEDPNRLLFFESLTFDNVRNGFVCVPGGETFRNRSVLSYHYYRPPNLSPHQTFAERLKEGGRLGCGTMLTEFFVKTGAPEGNNMINKRYLMTASEEMVGKKVGSKDRVEDVLDAADAYVQSWIGWEYKPFVSKTGSDMEDSLFDITGKTQLETAKKFSRTYPRAVFGKIISFTFDPSTADFILMYQVLHTPTIMSGMSSTAVADGTSNYAADSPAYSIVDSHASTEIFVHRDYHYPSGIHVSVNESCVYVKELEKTIQIHHFDACLGKTIEVRICTKDRNNIPA